MSAFRETEENFGVDTFLETPVKGWFGSTASPNNSRGIEHLKTTVF